MRGIAIVGLVLIALGLVALVTGGFSYTKNEEAADLGPLEINVQEKEKVRVPTPVSVGAVVAGVALLVVGMSRRGSST